MIGNENIVLRAVEPEDLDFLYQIENDVDMWIYSARKEPYSRYAIRRYIESCDQSVFERGQLRFMIAIDKTGATIGTVDLFDFDYNNRRSEVGIFIHPSYRGRGYATEAIGLICRTTPTL